MQHDEISQYGEYLQCGKNAWNNDFDNGVLRACCKSGFLANRGLRWLDGVCSSVCVCVQCSEASSRCLFCQKTSFICFCVWNNLPSSIYSLFPSIQTTTCLPVSLPLRVKERSIFRKYREHFFPFTSFISLHLWAHSLEKKGARLMGPSPLRDFAPLHFCLSFSLLCFSLGGFAMKGRRRTGTSGFW